MQAQRLAAACAPGIRFPKRQVLVCPMVDDLQDGIKIPLIFPALSGRLVRFEGDGEAGSTKVQPRQIMCRDKRRLVEDAEK